MSKHGEPAVLCVWSSCTPGPPSNRRLSPLPYGALCLAEGTSALLVHSTGEELPSVKIMMRFVTTPRKDCFRPEGHRTSRSTDFAVPKPKCRRGSLAEKKLDWLNTVWSCRRSPERQRTS